MALSKFRLTNVVSVKCVRLHTAMAVCAISKKQNIQEEPLKGQDSRSLRDENRTDMPSLEHKGTIQGDRGLLINSCKTGHHYRLVSKADHSHRVTTPDMVRPNCQTQESASYNYVTEWIKVAHT